MVHLENALGPLGHAPERIPCLEALREPLKGTLLGNSHRGNPLVVVGLGLLFWGCILRISFQEKTHLDLHLKDHNVSSTTDDCVAWRGHW